ncbi:MAG: hypothetical protein KGJ79_11775 [Alphaproteobacteria bacterium]|nr:hypothetical protein [Alphaproteobacteria bacterium]MDE2493064.1 hypothetical protein [Alphaproteobacteria bacterium]
MIDVQKVIDHLPHFDTFCSVRQLHEIAERLAHDDRFDVRVAGYSAQEQPIHQIRFGNGRTKVLLLGYPHCKEPICGLTVVGILSLLEQGNAELSKADVEWHIVPCIDPDGAQLNEAWSLKPFSLENYMRNFYVQAPGDQVDVSFPVNHKRLRWSRPSLEAKVLKGILDAEKPDFFFSLHNAWTGGAFFQFNRDIDHRYHKKLHEFLKSQHFPLQTNPIWKEVCPSYGAGISQIWSVKRHYDHLAGSNPRPEELLPYGASSWDYLEEIKPLALTMVAELGYVRHPMDESKRKTEIPLRKFKLRVDADGKYLATILLEEWKKVETDLDKESPLYRAAIAGGAFPNRDFLPEGGRPMSLHPTRDVLFNPQHNKIATEQDLFQAIIVDGGFWGLCQMYQYVRLMKVSRQTTVMQSAIARLDKAFDEAIADIQRYVKFSEAQVTDHDTLVRVQLGSGLTVLNAVIEEVIRRPMAAG